MPAGPILGTGFGDTFGASQGRSGSLKERMEKERDRLRYGEIKVAGAPPPSTVEIRILHGKEGVDGSSPSEGLSGTTKLLQKAAFLLPR